VKVILLADVKNVGKKDQIVEVADGYARNFLFVHKLAVPRTERGLEIVDTQKKKVADEFHQKQVEAQAIADKLKDIVLEFEARFSEDGRMYGTISTKQIVDELKSKHKLTLDKRKFIDHFLVNAAGITRLRIELFKGVVGTVTVKVREKK
jgi:large subunit ribosomal protein L9